MEAVKAPVLPWHPDGPVLCRTPPHMQTCQSVAQIKLAMCYFHLTVLSVSWSAPGAVRSSYRAREALPPQRERNELPKLRKIKLFLWPWHYISTVSPLRLRLLPFRKQHCFSDRSKEGLEALMSLAVPFQSVLEDWPQKGWKLTVCRCFKYAEPSSGKSCPSCRQNGYTLVWLWGWSRTPMILTSLGEYSNGETFRRSWAWRRTQKDWA